MKKNIFLLLSIFLVSIANSQVLSTSNKVCTIFGQIDNYSEPIFVIKNVSSLKRQKVERLNLINQRFIFKTNLNNENTVKIFSLNKRNNTDTVFKVFISPTVDSVSLNIDGNDLNNIEINKKQTDLDKIKFTKFKFQIEEERDSIYKLMQKLNTSIRLVDSNSSRKIADSLEVLNSLMSEKDSIGFNLDIEFIKNNPSSFQSLEILNYRTYRRPISIKIDSIFNIFKTLHPLVKESVKGLEEINEINKQISLVKGGHAPAFSIINANDKKLIKSNDIYSKSKITIIDFWASWCVPCREEFGALKETYKTHINDINIISISTDSDVKLFQKALMEEKFPWINGLITKDIYYKFFIPAIPYKYVVDDKSNIIEVIRGGGRENMEYLNKIIRDYLKQ
jgi:thiol-disulfide isomerase/thioredoxin